MKIGDKIIKIWKELNGEYKLIQNLTGHSHGIAGLVKVSKYELVSGSWDATIKLWKEENKEYKLMQTLPGNSSCRCLIKVFENVLVSGSLDGTINLWEFIS